MGSQGQPVGSVVHVLVNGDLAVVSAGLAPRRQSRQAPGVTGGWVEGAGQAAVTPSSQRALLRQERPGPV